MGKYGKNLTISRSPKQKITGSPIGVFAGMQEDGTEIGVGGDEKAKWKENAVINIHNKGSK